MSLSGRRKEIVQSITSFQDKNGFPPSLREICAALNLRSPGSLLKHMRRLEEDGILKKVPGKKRAWSLLQERHAISVPLIGRIAAGTPILAEENREEDLPVDPRLFGAPEAFALRVRGDSMIGAQIREGDLAIIRPQDYADDGAIVAVIIRRISTEATLKILKRREGHIELMSANPAYEPMIFTETEASELNILGKLIGVIRRRP
ncbi:MAG: repressor LexA [Thermodesulfobacteriota bacterium]|nr:repressor LexA [Thermodesulfobacteriota bacterium]